MKPYLRLSSFLLLLAGLFSCGKPYKDLVAQPQVVFSALRFTPAFERELYRCLVDGKFLLKKFHLSGLLLFKKMEDGTTRVVFQNEMGISFFDFEWNEKDEFKVNSIMERLNKPAVIKTLQKDIQLLLLKGLDKTTERSFQKNDLHYNRFSLENGFVYYISNQEKLLRVENAGKKIVTTITIGDKATNSSMPESAFFKHHKANFTIQLTKIVNDADE